MVSCEVALMVEREHCFTHFHTSPSLCTVPLSYFKIYILFLTGGKGGRGRGRGKGGRGMMRGGRGRNHRGRGRMDMGMDDDHNADMDNGVNSKTRNLQNKVF